MKKQTICVLFIFIAWSFPSGAEPDSPNTDKVQCIGPEVPITDSDRTPLANSHRISELNRFIGEQVTRLIEGEARRRTDEIVRRLREKYGRQLTDKQVSRLYEKQVKLVTDERLNKMVEEQVSQINQQLNHTTNSSSDIDTLVTARRSLLNLANEDWNVTTEALMTAAEAFLSVTENKTLPEEIEAHNYIRDKFKKRLAHKDQWLPPAHCYHGPLKGNQDAPPLPLQPSNGLVD